MAVPLWEAATQAEERRNMENVRSLLLDALDLTVHEVKCDYNRLLLDPKGWLEQHLKKLGYVRVAPSDTKEAA